MFKTIFLTFDYVFVCLFVFQHFTPGGVPFYVNPASEILKRCLGQPDVASSVVRYPVFGNDEIRYYLYLLHILHKP